MNYLTELRLQKAKTLLIETNLTLDQNHMVLKGTQWRLKGMFISDAAAVFLQELILKRRKQVVRLGYNEKSK
jgi:hypothetical protein